MVEIDRLRALVAVSAREEPALRSLFARAELGGWEPTVCDSFEKAHFVIQHAPFNVLLVDESLVAEQGPAGLDWLALQREVPAVLLANVAGGLWERAFEQGACACVPRPQSFEQPTLLAAALHRAIQTTQHLRHQRQTGAALRQCRRQVDRLVELLWRSAPLEAEGAWCTQRHVLERLQEEVARSGRHGTPLTVALGEVQSDDADAGADLADWAPRRLLAVKRRCDVAGQYGLRGFLLLLVHTPRDRGFVCCRRLQQALEQTPPREGPPAPVRACFGLASVTGPQATLQELLATAERRLDVARRGTAERVVAG
jgi:GGDEF domain-containing protein